MTAEAALPNWPRLLSAGQAARYVGVSKTTFLEGVGRTWPKPIAHRRRRLWDIRDLDAAVDALKDGGGDGFVEGLKCLITG